MNTWTLFWMDGNKEVINGKDLDDAFRQAGHDQITLKKVAFYVRNQSDKYIFDKVKKIWLRK